MPSDPPSPEEKPPVVLPPPAPEDGPAPVAALTPEEQMALFAKELKENDWGHQPC